MKRACLGFLIVLAACVVASPVETTQYRTPRAEVVFPGGLRVTVEVADSPAERQQGLMNRTHLAPDAGMIFVFEQPGPYGFWMKNTLIPLDMFWLDAQGRIVSIAESVPPCGNTSESDNTCPTTDPTAAALYVVETVAGFAKQHGIAVGESVTITGLSDARGR